MTDRRSRRAFLGLTAGATVALAGCADAVRRLTGGNDARSDAEAGTDPYRARQSVPPDATLPLDTHEVPLSNDLAAFETNATSGGVPKDGIPSIDDPEFTGTSAGDDQLDPGSPVFGVTLGGEARAYPQRILDQHEIVNDGFSERGVAVTYCPLTGTALAFERGAVEFGVSGMLVNSNLIMYDRETDSWWPQVLGTSVLGERKGLSLREIRAVWTTWERWKRVHPDTGVLTEETGHAKDYSRDPYGSYNPRSGYYKSGDPWFAPMHTDDRHPPKEVFIGARSADGAVAFHKNRLRRDRLLEATVGGVPYVAAYHSALDSAWVYRNPDRLAVERAGGGYRVEGQDHSADALPLETVTAVDAMWFAWVGFYPETTVVA